MKPKLDVARGENGQHHGVNRTVLPLVLLGMAHSRFVLSGALALLVAGCQDARSVTPSPAPQAPAPSASTRAPEPTASAPAAPAQAAAPSASAAAPSEAVGTARLLADGTIELDMFRPSARLTYGPRHPQYLEVRAHIERRGGLLVPGAERSVPPFPPSPVPATSAKIAGAIAREVAREVKSWTASDPRRGMDVFVAPVDAPPRLSTLAASAQAPGRPGLRIPSAIASVLARAITEVEAEKAVIESYDVDAAVTDGGASVAVVLAPHLAPGEAPHPGGGTSLGKELHLDFDAKTSTLRKRLYAR